MERYNIRDVEKSLGNGDKVPAEVEIKNRFIVRKSIVARLHIKSGEKFTENNVTTKRPFNGLSPMEWDNVIGKISEKNYLPDEPIK